MNKGELVSIIVPMYNAEKYIKNTVDAIRAQDYYNLDVIMVNDGSTDNTRNVCQECIAGDKRFRIFDIKNAGPSASRNYGLKCARGEYITFIDADDYIYPEYVSCLYTMILDYDADMACCEYYKLWENRQPPHISGNITYFEFDRITALKNMYCKRYITGYPCLKLYKAKLISNLFFPEEISYAEDIVFVDMAIKRCNKVVYCNKILYLYYQHPVSATHEIDVKRLYNAWAYNVDYFCEKSLREYPELSDAVLCKQFIMGLDILSRIWFLDTSFKKQLITYIKSINKNVLHNPECERIPRILSYMTYFNLNGTVLLCAFYGFLQKKFKIQKSKAV